MRKLLLLLRYFILYCTVISHGRRERALDSRRIHCQNDVISVLLVLLRRDVKLVANQRQEVNFKNVYFLRLHSTDFGVVSIAVILVIKKLHCQHNACHKKPVNV